MRFEYHHLHMNLKARVELYIKKKGKKKNKKLIFHIEENEGKVKILDRDVLLSRSRLLSGVRSPVASFQPVPRESRRRP